MDYSLSSEDIIRNLHPIKVKIIPYSEIHTYKTINQLLQPYNAVVILYMTKTNYGHWTLLFRNEKFKTIEFFDSYGYMIDDQLKFSKNKLFNEDQKQNHFYLTRLLLNAPKKYKIIYNHFHLQKKSPVIATCGRWVVLRLLNSHKTLEDFYKDVVNKTKELGYGKNYDKMTTELTN